LVTCKNISNVSFWPESLAEVVQTLVRLGVISTRATSSPRVRSTRSAPRHVGHWASTILRDASAQGSLAHLFGARPFGVSRPTRRSIRAYSLLDLLQFQLVGRDNALAHGAFISDLRRLESQDQFVDTLGDRTRTTVYMSRSCRAAPPRCDLLDVHVIVTGRREIGRSTGLSTASARGSVIWRSTHYP